MRGGTVDYSNKHEQASRWLKGREHLRAAAINYDIALHLASLCTCICDTKRLTIFFITIPSLFLITIIFT